MKGNDKKQTDKASGHTVSSEMTAPWNFTVLLKFFFPADDQALLFACTHCVAVKMSIL